MFWQRCIALCLCLCITIDPSPIKGDARMVTGDAQTLASFERQAIPGSLIWMHPNGPVHRPLMSHWRKMAGLLSIIVPSLSGWVVYLKSSVAMATPVASAALDAAQGTFQVIAPPTLHTVMESESLSQIASHYGLGSWTSLYEANALLIGKNPNLIHQGQALVIPGTETWSVPQVQTPLSTNLLPLSPGSESVTSPLVQVGHLFLEHWMLALILVISLSILAALIMSRGDTDPETLRRSSAIATLMGAVGLALWTMTFAPLAPPIQSPLNVHPQRTGDISLPATRGPSPLSPAVLPSPGALQQAPPAPLEMSQVFPVANLPAIVPPEEITASVLNPVLEALSAPTRAVILWPDILTPITSSAVSDEPTQEEPHSPLHDHVEGDTILNSLGQSIGKTAVVEFLREAEETGVEVRKEWERPGRESRLETRLAFPESSALEGRVSGEVLFPAIRFEPSTQTSLLIGLSKGSSPEVQAGWLAGFEPVNRETRWGHVIGRLGAGLGVDLANGRWRMGPAVVGQGAILWPRVTLRAQGGAAIGSGSFAKFSLDLPLFNREGFGLNLNGGASAGGSELYHVHPLGPGIGARIRIGRMMFMPGINLRQGLRFGVGFVRKPSRPSSIPKSAPASSRRSA